MSKLFLQIAQNEKPDAELIADANDVLVGLGEKWKLEQDYLGDSVFANHFLDLIGRAKHRDSVVAVVDLFIGDQTDRAQTDLGFALQPIAQLRGPVARTDEHCFFFPPENASRQERREIVMRKEQRDVEPRNKIEEKDSRNERVFGRDQIEDEQADAGDGLAQAQPMRPKQFILQKIIFRADVNASKSMPRTSMPQ